jgi:acyl-CoA thioesterase FadM
MAILSRWAVVESVAVEATDLDADGRPSDSALDRWSALVRDRYLERCTTLQARLTSGATALEAGAGSVRASGRLEAGDELTVAATVAELRPSSFDLRVRLRGPGGDIVGEGTERLVVVDAATGDRAIPEDVRRELIAIEQGATEFA